MDWTSAVLRLIELHTFQSFWYWLAVIVSWSVASNWLIGIPFDMLFRARKLAAQELADLEAMVDINVRRIVALNALFGTAMTGMIAFGLSALALMSLVYQIEVAQGLLALCAPLTAIVIVNMRLAHSLHQSPMQGRELVQRLFKVRLWTQAISMVAIFFTAMYGMYHAISSQQFF